MANHLQTTPWQGWKPDGTLGHKKIVANILIWQTILSNQRRLPVDSNPIELTAKTLSPFSQALCKVFHETKNIMEQGHVPNNLFFFGGFSHRLQLRWIHGGEIQNWVFTPTFCWDILMHVGGIYPLLAMEYEALDWDSGLGLGGFGIQRFMAWKYWPLWYWR